MHHHVDKDKSYNMQPYLDANPWCVEVVRQNRAKKWIIVYLNTEFSFCWIENVSEVEIAKILHQKKAGENVRPPVKVICSPPDDSRPENLINNFR